MASPFLLLSMVCVGDLIARGMPAPLPNDRPWLGYCQSVFESRNGADATSLMVQCRSLYYGTGQLHVTGCAGLKDVREAVDLALCWVRHYWPIISRQLRLPEGWARTPADLLSDERDLHVHLSPTVVFKNPLMVGGVAAVALISLLSDRAPKEGLAVLGEIDMSGWLSGIEQGSLSCEVLEAAVARGAVKTLVVDRRSWPKALPSGARLPDALQVMQIGGIHDSIADLLTTDPVAV